MKDHSEEEYELLTETNLIKNSIQKDTRFLVNDIVTFNIHLEKFIKGSIVYYDYQTSRYLLEFKISPTVSLHKGFNYDSFHTIMTKYKTSELYPKIPNPEKQYWPPSNQATYHLIRRIKKFIKNDPTYIYFIISEVLINWIKKHEKNNKVYYEIIYPDFFLQEPPLFKKHKNYSGPNFDLKRKFTKK